MIIVNTRCLTGPFTGVQRYLREILGQIGQQLKWIAPKSMCRGMAGHGWEQLILPLHVGSGILWSPCNTGPLAVHNQIVTIHDIAPIDHPEWFNPRFAAWYQFLLPKLTKRIAHIITVSEFSKSRIMETLGVPEGRITVIHNGVDAHFKSCTSKDYSVARAALNIPCDKYILSVASQEPRKNIQNLLIAWERLIKEIPEDVWLVIVGAGDTKLVFKNISYRQIPPRVYFTGRIADSYLPLLYSSAITFTYLSVYEGFGLPPLEAMACGCPVIASNAASLPEVCGDAALYIDPFCTDSIADGILKLIKNVELRKSFIEKGFANAAKFSWFKTAQQHLKIFEETPLQ
jgi:glycosyltransferase involved in cell wall biosynthesis